MAAAHAVAKAIGSTRSPPAYPLKMAPILEATFFWRALTSVDTIATGYELGRGALAIVSLRDGEAVKAVPKALLIALRCTEDALREQSALQAACTGSDVPHVLPRLLGTAQDAHCIYFRLEAVLCEGASVQLDQVLRAQIGHRLLPASAACVAGCVLGALAHLHARRVAHRDVKPANLVLGADGLPRLVDFGHALLLPSGGVAAEAGGPARGTAPYAAPELQARAAHGYAVDCWSVGVLVHEALTGAPPPCAETHDAAGAAAAAGVETASVAAAAAPLLEALLRNAPEDRLGAHAAAEHAWLRSEGWAASQLGRGRREPLLAAAAAAAAANEGSARDATEAAEAAEEQAWAAAEREELISRGEALWRREPARWDADFDAFARASGGWGLVDVGSCAIYKG